MLATDLANGESRLLIPGQASAGALADAALKAARRDESTSIEADGKSWFLTVFNPPLDLAIIGAVHIAQPLARIAVLADYAVRVIDPRTAFATAERFPNVALSHDWPDEALRTTPLTARSAIVALTHDPKLSVAFSCLAFGGLELTVGVSWAIPLDIGGDFAGCTASVMNMCGNIGGAISPALLAYLETLGVNARAVAVELNDVIIERSAYEGAELHDGDVVEIVRMVGGG